MNNATKLKAKFVVYTMVGSDESEKHSPIVRAVMRTVRRVKAWWWIQKVNHMSEGEILDLYYLLTNDVLPEDAQ